ncbi:MAG: hypothetical protein KC502_02150 [Myxococcales bacterium]|nr:hypothetical protein [Myxococcales bacterium]
MASSPNPLLETLDSSELIICIGSGGVGKTTSSAALALLAALRGRKTLVLTIDPAKRLLQALGLHDDDLPANTPLEVFPRMTSALSHPEPGPFDLGTEKAGSLHAMMLDPEQGASLMVERLLPDKSVREEVLANRIYRALLPALSASPDLVALELIADLHRENNFDLIVLDTPPAHNTMDFLQAGQTFSNFINERVLKWFSRVPRKDSAHKRSIFRRGGSVAMSVLGRLFGAEILPDIAEFFYSFREVMPLMRERNEQTDALMRSDVTAFIAVTAPGATSLREAYHLRELLETEGLPFAGFVVNRVLQAPASLSDEETLQQLSEDLQGRLESTGVPTDQAENLAARVREGAKRLHFMDRADRTQVKELRKLAGDHAFCAVVPQMEHDIHVLDELRDLANQLVAGVTEAA